MMNRAILIGALFCAAVPTMVSASATYYEASGQTNAFTLTAGAKAGWNSSASPIISTQKMSKGMFGISSIAASGGALRIAFSGKLPANALVSVYNLRGARVASAPVSGASLVVGNALSNGAYAVRVVANGMILSSSRFTMVR